MDHSIVIIIRSLANGGAEKQSILLARALMEHYPVHYVILSDTPQHPAHVRNLNGYGIPHTFLQGNIWKKIRAFVSLLRSHKADVLFSFLPGDMFFAGLAAKWVGLPHFFGGFRSASIPENYKRIALRLLHNTWVEATIANSHLGKQYMIDQGFRADKMRVIHNGMIIDTQPMAHPEGDKIRILSVGRFVPAKDYETAIRAISLLKKRSLRKPFIYTIIGEGVLEQEVRQWIRDYQCEDVIEVVLDPPNIPEYYQQADIYFCSSLVEGLSNTLMEAMSFSLPIVATEAGDNEYLSVHGQNGYITPLKDAEGLATHLEQLIHDADLRMQMGAAGYTHLVQTFSYEAFQQKYLTLIQQLGTALSPTPQTATV